MSETSASSMEPATRRNKLRWTSLLLLPVLLGGGLGFWWWWQKEPIYQGMRFNHWMERQSWEQITAAALELGLDQSLPSLIRALHKSDSPVHQAKLRLWDRLPSSIKNRYYQYMPHPADGLRFRTLLCLAEIGPDAEAAAPSVIHLFQTETNQGQRLRYMGVLADIGADSPSAISALAAALDDADPAIRENAAIPALVKELEHPASHHATWMPPFCYPRGLVVGFNSEQTAAWLLGELGSLAKPAVPALTKTLESPEPLARIAAARALWKIERDASQALPVLIAVLKAREQSEREAALAARVIEEMGPAAKPAARALRDAWLHGPRVLRHAATDALRAVQSRTGK